MSSNFEDYESVRRSQLTLSISDESGRLIDSNALAHEVSVKGFVAETQLCLSPADVIVYTLAATTGQALRGRSVIVWAKKKKLSYLIGANFIDQSWIQRWELRRLIAQPSIEFAAILDKTFKMVGFGLLLGLSWIILHSHFWMTLLRQLFPKILAVVVMGVALRELFRRRQ